MKAKLKKILVVMLVLLSIVLTQKTFASDIVDEIRIKETTSEFKEWTMLSDEEKEKVLMPNIYAIEDNTSKTRKKARLLGAGVSHSNTEFTLKDVIINNVVVKNQMNTNSCWTFASLASLETNLALADYYNQREERIYDFSERHMEYATSRNFANNQINEEGFYRSPGELGNWMIAEAYLTNGQGAINESKMPFENNQDLIDISHIKNKEVVTKVYDTVYFSSENTNELRQQIKDHIKKYGAVFAGVHGATILSESSICYNNLTGAMYCNNSQKYPMDHAVSIVGWNDSYSVENFNEGARPTANGAWIVKNSWGDKVKVATLEQFKEMAFSKLTNEQKAEYNLSEASQISNELVEQSLPDDCIIDGENIMRKIGDDGFMYISYEDANIYTTLWGITKATENAENETIYGYNNLGWSVSINTPEKKIYIANAFDKKTSKNEYLTEVSINTGTIETCKVYVNPNGTSKSKNDLQKVELLAGESETVGAGYHTLEFAKPVKITGSSFAVVVEMETADSSTPILIEAKRNDVERYNSVVVERDKCFISMSLEDDTNNWQDLSKMSEVNNTIPDGDSTIKAFTVSKVNEETPAPQEETPTHQEGNVNIEENLSLGSISEDNTTATGVLPQTGTNITMIIFIIIIAIAGLGMYAKYKKISKYVK